MKTKWPIKVCEFTYPAGTEVRAATVEETRIIFGEIAPKHDSFQVSVWFPGMEHPTIVQRGQICE